MSEPITLAVEGMVDDAVARRLVVAAGGNVGLVYTKQGKPRLRDKLNGYNAAARLSPWFVLTDLDREHACAPELVATWIPQPAAGMCFRVAVRSVEAWLLADRPSFASFLRVACSHVPGDVEAVPDPKGLVVEIARQSRSSEIRSDLVPAAGAGRRTGPAYASRIVEFVTDRWDPLRAAEGCDSLDRALQRIGQLARAGQ